MTVAGAVPTVARDFVGLADPARGEHDCLGAENLELSALAIVAEGPDQALAVLEQREHADFHVHVNATMHAVILQRANHLQPRAIADMGEARILMAAKIALEN